MSDLLESIEDGVAWLTLNRPDRLNALSIAMRTRRASSISMRGERSVRETSRYRSKRCPRT